MKKLFSAFMFFFLFIICFCFSNCKKKVDKPSNIDTTTVTPKLNIVLYDKPLDTIQQYIQGKWTLIYSIGGVGVHTEYYHDIFWELTNDRVKIANSGSIIADTTIHWIYSRGTYTNGDSTYVMNFHDNSGYIYDYVVDKIYDDTLILHEDASDAYFYHFIKSN